jgi:ATP-binding cassette subfamily C protein
VLLVVAATPWLVRRGTTPGQIVGAFTYLVQGLHAALGTLVGGLTGSATRLVAILGRLAETGDAGSGTETETGGIGTDTAGEPGSGTTVEPGRPAPGTRAPAGPGVELRRVTFAYGRDSEPVVRDLDLVVPPGDHLAVVGPSGIGKSTLAALVAGVAQPGRGEVRLGGVPAHEVTPASRVLIPQQAYVFAGTLGENLRYLCPGAPDAALDRAVEAVGLRPLAVGLGGYGAHLHPEALGVGERQLVALARAYLSPARLVILDEATCHLDPPTEAVAERAFLDRGGTLVVVAHRISSALRARRVLVLDGNEARLGTHDDLVGSSALYRDLVGAWQGGGAAPVGGAEAVRT